MPFTPRPFQAKFCSEVIPHWRTRDKALCALGMGGGKTHTTLHLFGSMLTDGTVWVVMHKADLVLQWFASAPEHDIAHTDICIIASKFTIPTDEHGQKLRGTIEEQANKRLGLRMGCRVVICMVKQIEKSGKSKPLEQAELFGMMPKYVVIDEFHRTRWYEGCRQLLVASWNRDQSFKTLALTGTPVSAGKNVVHVSDHVDPRDWFIPATNAEMIRDGFWSEDEYPELPEDYVEAARLAFKGIPPEKDGDVSGTSQRAVMLSLLDWHVRLIAEYDRRHGETMLMFCATTDQAELMAEALTIATGELWLAPNSKGDTKDNPKVLASMSTGVYEGQAFRGACVVGMWVAGTDIPKCCTIGFPRIMNSLPEILQAGGRGVRLYFGEYGELLKSLSCRILDFGLNFIGKHPRLRDVDFRNEEQWSSDLQFADAHSLMCQNPGCLFVHKRIPTPKHPHGLKLGQPWGHSGDTIDTCTGKVIKGTKGPTLKIDLLTGIFSDGISADVNEPLQCQECGSPVMGDRFTIERYIEWKRNPGEGEKPKRMGITIGLDGSEMMTLASMWEYGLWQKLEEDAQGTLDVNSDAEAKVVDNSESWEARRDRVRVFRQSEASRQKRTKVLSPKHQSVATVLSEIIRAKSTASPEALKDALRRAMLKAYMDSQSPLDVMSLVVGFGSLKDFPGLRGGTLERETALLIEAFEGLYSRVQRETPSRSDCYREFEDWINEYLDEADQLMRLQNPDSIQYRVLSRKVEQLTPLLQCIQTFEPLQLAAA